MHEITHRSCFIVAIIAGGLTNEEIHFVCKQKHWKISYKTIGSQTVSVGAHTTIGEPMCPPGICNNLQSFKPRCSRMVLRSRVSHDPLCL